MTPLSTIQIAHLDTHEEADLITKYIEDGWSIYGRFKQWTVLFVVESVARQPKLEAEG